MLAFFFLLVLTSAKDNKLTTTSSSSSSYNGTLVVAPTGCTLNYLSENQDTIITLQNCTSSNFTFYNWNQCFNLCCYQANQKNFSPLTYSSLQMCPLNVVTSTAAAPITTLGIILIVTLTVVVALLIICCVCMCCKSTRA